MFSIIATNRRKKWGTKMKKVIVVLLSGLLILSIGCNPQLEEQEYQRYSTHFIDTFDTVIQVIGYTSSEAEFFEYADEIYRHFKELHKLYDKFNDYEGINNIKTINDNSGIQPIKVEQEIIDMILFSKEWHKRTQGKMNIAMGNLLVVWEESMEQAMSHPEEATLPLMEVLQAASANGNIHDVIVDSEAMTVFLADENMSLDVGGVAKGFAAELIGREMIAKGFTSGVIIAGGNWKILGKPQEAGKEHWTVGIQNPDKPYVLNEAGILAKVFTEDKSVDTSGDYQRYVMIEGLRAHHLIDPETLMPGNYHRGVTVLADDAGVSDYLSTELFLLPYEQGRTLVDSLDGIEAFWIMADGTIKATEGMQDSLWK